MSRNGETADINMVVPIDLLPPILDDLLTRGQVSKPPRPWLGAFSAESNGKVVVMSVAEGGPAAKAGLRQGDIISDIRDGEVDGLADFYRKLWESGPAGAEVPMQGGARRPRHLAARQVGRPQQLSQEAASAVNQRGYRRRVGGSLSFWQADRVGGAPGQRFRMALPRYGPKRRTRRW